MFLGSITYLMYFLGAILGLGIIIGFFTLIWFAILEIIKCHKRRIKALNANINTTLQTHLLDQS
jgi:ABC-type siderophore export system fused ATPase/permease subunit